MRRQRSTPPSQALPSYDEEWRSRSRFNVGDAPWQCRRGVPEARGSAPRCRSHEALHCSEKQASQFDRDSLNDTDDFVKKYRLEKRLAAGVKGIVYLATERPTGQTVVVKKPNDISDTSDFDQLVHKRHPNILRVFECFCSHIETCVVMEFCAGGDLFLALDRIGTPSHTWSAAVFEQTLIGVKYLHERFDESHNDLKLENLLLDHEPASSQDVPRVIIADFDCAARTGSLTQATGGGDPRYRAPETFQNQPFGLATDMWALGVMLFELLSGGLLIHINQRNMNGFRAFRKHQGGELCERYMTMLESGHPVDVGVIRGDEARGLIQGLLEVNPRKRLAMEAVLSHQWMRMEVVDDCSRQKQVERIDMPAPLAIPSVKGREHEDSDGDQARPRSPKKWGGC